MSISPPGIFRKREKGEEKEEKGRKRGRTKLNYLILII